MQRHYYDYTLSSLIAPGYPAGVPLVWQSGRTLKLFGFEQRGPALPKALEADGGALRAKGMQERRPTALASAHRRRGLDWPKLGNSGAK